MPRLNVLLELVVYKSKENKVFLLLLLFVSLARKCKYNTLQSY